MGAIPAKSFNVALFGFAFELGLERCSADIFGWNAVTARPVQDESRIDIGQDADHLGTQIAP